MDNLINLHDYEIQAKKILSKEVFDFYAGGSLDERTLQKNLTALSDLCFLPKVLKDVSCCETQINLLGMKLSMPIMSAPMAFQCLAHSDGETAMSQACHKAGLGNIISTMSSKSLEIIKKNNQLQAWFQLYIFKDRKITLDLLSRAKAAGYQGLVLTVDVPVMGKRERDIYNQFRLPSNVTPVNFTTFNKTLSDPRDPTPFINFVNSQFDQTITWDDIDWLKSKTSLPLILKGIAHPDDANRAIQYGADGIIVSNHGGRQLDDMPSSIELLSNITQQTNKKIPILMGGGIRRGSDILKALLLGANAVLVGRPLLWGLTVGAQKGVENVLSILKQELLEAMMLTGITNINSINGNENILLKR